MSDLQAMVSDFAEHYNWFTEEEHRARFDDRLAALIRTAQAEALREAGAEQHRLATGSAPDAAVEIRRAFAMFSDWLTRRAEEVERG